MLPAVVVVVLAGLSLPAALWLHGRGDHPAVDDEIAWEASHRDQILGLKSTAEQLAISHRLAEAHAKYGELRQLVTGRQIADSELQAVVAQTRSDQALIYQMLIAAEKPQQAPATREVPEPYPARFDPFKGGPATGPVPGRPVPGGPVLPPVPGGREAAPAGVPTVLPPVPGATPGAAPGPGPSASAPESRPAVADPAKSGPHLYHAGDHATDEDVAVALRHGVNFLLSRFKDGDLDDGLSPRTSEHAAQDALVVYALLHAGQALRDDDRLDVRGPLMSAAVERLKQMRLATDPNLIQAPVTYGRSLRAAALAVYNRPEDRDVLAADVAWLVQAHTVGAYTYDDRLATLRTASLADPAAALRRAMEAAGGSSRFGGQQPLFERQLPGGAGQPPSHPFTAADIWDNSNGNYAVMGVAAGAEAGVDVPAQYWHDVEKHWIDCQLDDGEWAYAPDQQSGSMAMTCGGVASLLAAHDFLDVAGFGARLNTPPLSRPIGAGLGWLERDDNAVDVYNPKTVYLGYNLHGVERVGLATGYKHLGKHDWFGELAAQAVVTQWPKGSWGRKDEGVGAIIDTSFVVTFLSRGRHPVMMTKLRFPPVWDNRPRDLANLAKFAGRELGRPLNWEAVGFDHDWWEWTDAPILYVASHRFPQLKEDDEAKIKAYVEAGGVLFTHADASDPSMDKWSTDLAKRLFPAYDLKDLPPDSPVYTLVKPVPAPLPKLKGVSNGARLLMVHAPVDLALAWHQQAEKAKPAEFDVGLNLYAYAAGQDHPRNRLDPFFVPTPPRPGATTVPVARVRYAGDWDPEPGAWRRLSAALPLDTGLSPAAAAVDPAALKAADFPLRAPDRKRRPRVHRRGGRRRPRLRDRRRHAAGRRLRRVDRVRGVGGVRRVGRVGPAAQGVPRRRPRALTADDPLMNPTLRGMTDLTAPRLRAFAADRPNTAGFKIQQVSAGKGKVIYSPLDLTSGLLGTNTWGIAGYDPAYATAVLKNVVVWTAARRGL